MKNNDSLWNKEIWTQNEVAGYCRVSPATIKNWREKGKFSYVKVPGSSRVFYYRDEIIAFIERNTIHKKGGGKTKGKKPVNKRMPVVSSTDDDWRI